MQSLHKHGTQEEKLLLNKLSDGLIEMSDIENLCALINNEFMMKGLLPSYEPSQYGIELENLLDVVNRPRIQNKP